MNMRIGALLLSGCLLGLLCSGPASADFKELVRRIPANANAIVMIDAEKIFNSDAAKAGNWRENRVKAWESGVSFLPPTATHAILAVHLDHNVSVNVWEVAMMKLDRDPSLKKLAEMSGGTMDKFGARSAVQMTGDSYIVDFGGRVVGAMAPGNRQMVGRWVRESDGGQEVPLSPYLKEAYRYANDIGTPIILALDLEDAVSEDDVRAGVEGLPKEFGLDTINRTQLASSLASIRGVTLGITLRSTPFGKIKVDFGKPIPLPAATCKAILLHALAKRGAMIDEFEEWTPTISGTTVTMEGNLTQSGMTRLSSLFHRPPAIPDEKLETKPATEISPNDQLSMKDSTLRYWGEMSKLLEDLAKKPSSSGAKTMGQVGVWCNKYAARIEKLPTLNVDPDLLDFTAKLCSNLRLIHSTIHAGAATGSAQARAVTPTYNTFNYGETYGYTWYGAVGYHGTYAVPDMRQYYNDQSRVKYEANSKATFDVRQTAGQIRAAVSDMRRQLTEKYKTQFQ